MPQCTFCKTTVATVYQAIDLGWIPSFYMHGPATEVETGEPACPACQEEHLDVEPETGEFVLKPGHSVPPATE